jgi:nucleoside-diphosphate-sugar epimerase
MNKFFLPTGGGHTATILDLAQKIARKTGASIKHIEPDKYDLSGKVDNNAIQSLTGWKPCVSIEKMIEEAVNTVEITHDQEAEHQLEK